MRIIKNWRRKDYKRIQRERNYTDGEVMRVDQYGNKLSDEDDYCPNCDAFLEDIDYEWCTNCGEFVGFISNTVMQDDQVIQYEITVECVNCGYENDINNKYCPNCGKKPTNISITISNDFS